MEQDSAVEEKKNPSIHTISGMALKEMKLRGNGRPGKGAYCRIPAPQRSPQEGGRSGGERGRPGLREAQGEGEAAGAVKGTQRPCGDSVNVLLLLLVMRHYTCDKTAQN